MQPYSMDLRVRAWALLKEGASSLEVAEQLGVSDSCVRKWRMRKRQDGTLEPRARTQGRKREFTAAHDAALDQAVRGVPDATLRELAAAVSKKLGRVFSLPVISRALQRLGFTRKKNGDGHRARSRRCSAGAASMES